MRTHRFAQLRLLRGVTRRSMAAGIGLAILLGFAAAMVVQPVLLPHGAATGDVAILAGPSLRHPFGTDANGHDVLARVLHGIRYAFAVPLAAVLLAIAVGVPAGMAAGLVGGRTDRVLQRLFQGVMTVPPLLLAPALVAGMGPSVLHAVIALAALEAVVFARIMGAEVHALRRIGFVEGNVAMGVSLPRLVAVHLLPNTMAGLAGAIPRRVAWALATFALIGFLGLGPAAGATEWGTMIRQAMEPMLADRWWLGVFPAAALVMVGFALNLLAAGLTDLRAARVGQAGAVLPGAAG